MIRLNGKELFQWDTGRTITVENENATEVHFANSREIAYTVEIGNPSSVKIPSKLLKVAKPIIAYMFVKNDDDGGMTVRRRCFQVLPRPKPDDYVDEGEEGCICKELDERLTKIENLLNSGEEGQILTKENEELKWVNLDGNKIKIDLSDYYTKEDIDDKLNGFSGNTWESIS